LVLPQVPIRLSAKFEQQQQQQQQQQQSGSHHLKSFQAKEWTGKPHAIQNNPRSDSFFQTGSLKGTQLAIFC
jgi:hypothetical protein